MQSIDYSEIASPWLTKDCPKSESHFQREIVMETDDTLHRPNLYFMHESASEPIHGQCGLQRKVEDVITDQRPISFNYEAVANLNGYFKPYPNFATSQSNISMKQIHNNTLDICTANENRSSHNNDQSMDIIEKDSGLDTVNSKSPIIIKEELIEMDEYTDDTNNHMSSNIALQIKMEREDTSDSETHSPKTNQSELSSCGNENNFTTVTTISTVCKEELDLEDVQSIMVKEELTHNVDEIDIKLEASLRDDVTKYSKSDNDINSDSTCDNEKQQYMCHSCPRKFPTRRGFIDHLISHHAKFVVYKCPSCEISFSTKAALSEHCADCQSKSQVGLNEPMLASSQVNEPNRPLVTIQFMSNNSVKVNKTKAQGQLVTCAYRCLICRTAFKAEISLRNHLEKAPSCKKCLKLFCSPTELLIHNKVHGNDILFQCASCKRQFKNKERFRIHISRKQIICGTCGKTFCENVKFLEHKKKCWHWPMPADLFSCNLCSKKFSSPEKLVNHIAEHSISCGLCSRKFVTSSSLLSHNKRDHKGILTEETLGSEGANAVSLQTTGPRPRDHKGILTEKTFGSEGANVVSLQTISYSSKMRNRTAKHSISCGLCPQKCLTPSGLMKHKKKCCHWPRPADLISCILCSKKFGTPRQMRIHMAEHLISCGLCPQKFLTSSSLLNHNETDHKNRLYEETQSTKGVNSISLETVNCPTNMMDHMAERSISCGLCPQKFLTSSSLLNHNDTDHKDRLPEDTSSSNEANSINLATISCPTKMIDHTAEQSISCGLRPQELRTSFNQTCDFQSTYSHKKSVRLKIVEERSEGRSLKKFDCQICRSKFDTPKKLRNHLRGSISCGPFPSFSRTNEPNKFSVGLKKVEGRSEGRSLRKFDCRICKSEFDSEQKLKIHINKPQETCNACGEKFCENIDIREHKETCWPSPGVLISCKLCSEKFSAPTQLRIHMAEHSLLCGLCLRKFLTSSSLLNHNKRNHKDKQHEGTLSPKEVKTIGAETISCPTKMKEHTAEHSILGGLSPQKFLTSSSLLNHTKRDHKDKQIQETFSAKEVKAIRAESISCPTKMVDHSTEHWISCGLCPQKFLTSSSLLSHNETDHKDRLSDKLLKETVSAKGINAISLQTISCPTVKIRNHGAEHLNSGGLSPQKFLTSSSLLNHNETDHKDKLATLGSKAANAISLHTISCPTKMKEHSNSGGLSPQNFLTSSSLLNHNETDHKDNRPKDTSGSKGANSINRETNRTKCASNKILRQNHVCTKQICPDYYQHNRRRLSGCKLKLMFPCSFCSSRFKSPEKLSSHIRTKHSFACTVCPERFSYPSDLLIHKYEAHSERRFVGCPFCLKKIVVRHFCEHSKKCRKRDKQIPRFKCVFCDKEFGSAKNLQLHRKKLCLKRYVLVGKTNEWNEFDAVESTNPSE